MTVWSRQGRGGSLTVRVVACKKLKGVLVLLVLSLALALALLLFLGAGALLLVCHPCAHPPFMRARPADACPRQVLSRLLPIVIGKLGPGASPAVQKKVLEILSHVNKRIRALPALRLPLHELATFYAGGWGEEGAGA